VISVEVERPGREGLEALAAEADVVFYSKSWAQVRQGSLVALRCSGKGPKLTVAGQRIPIC
jgi:ketohexokinase